MENEYVITKNFNDQQQYLKNINNILVNDTNILSFSKAEMDGMSDIFAFLQEENGMRIHFLHMTILVRKIS